MRDCHDPSSRAARPALFALALLLALWPGASALAQGGGHTLFGDFKVDESKTDGIKPEDLSPVTFDIILYSNTGQIIRRQTITSNGRYRFLEVPNGEYDIVVESENVEVARVRVHLAYAYTTDHRQDIALEMRPNSAARPAGAQTVSAADFYKRTGPNETLFRRAEKASEKKEHAEAVALLRQLVSADPKDFAAWARLGSLLLTQKEFAEAEKALARAVEERPAYAHALFNLGRARMAQKNYAGAAEALARSVEAHPQSPTAHYLLGESYLQIKKGSKAVVHLNEALRLDPVGKADAHLRLALLYNAAGMKDRAAAEYEQFLAKRPEHPDRERLRQYIAEHKRPAQTTASPPPR